jgi:hypothetical protein
MTVPPPQSLFSSIYRSRFGWDLDLGLDVYWTCHFVGDSVSDKISHITSSALGCSLVYILHCAYSIPVQGVDPFFRHSNSLFFVLLCVVEFGIAYACAYACSCLR